MAIVKETGEGLADANVYADLDDLTSFATMRNIDLSAYDDTQKESALFISAQDWVDDLHSFKGEPLSDTQGMKLPTSEVSLPNADIVSANCLTAVQQLQGLLFVAVTADSSLGNIKSTMSKLDKLEDEIVYQEGTAIVGGTYDTTKADNKLKPYLSNSGQPRMLSV